MKQIYASARTSDNVFRIITQNQIDLLIENHELFTIFNILIGSCFYMNEFLV